MAYDNFSTQKVFSNELVNIYSNKILDNVLNNFEASEAKFMVKGELSGIIQGAALSELPAVQFVTNDAAVYNHLVKNLQAIISVDTQLSFQNRIQVVTSYAFFEFWLDPTAVSVMVNGISCEDLGGVYNAPVSPYNIILADPQVFSESVENELYYQGWKSSYKNVLLYHIVGDPTPPALNVDFTVEDVFLTLPQGKYSSFRISTYTAYWRGQPNTGFIDLVPPIPYSPPGGYEITPETLDQSIEVVFQDFSLVSPGNISFLMRTMVHGIRADSNLSELYLLEYDIPFEMKILLPDDLTTSKEALHFPHIREEMPLPGQQIEVITGNNFGLSIPEYFVLTGGNLVEGAPTYGRKNYTGSGRQVLTISMSEEFGVYENPVFSDSMVFTYNISRNGKPMKESHTVRLSAYMFAAHGFLVNPEALEFFSIKGIEAGDPQALEVISTQDFTVNAPFWLKIDPTAGGNFQELTVEPISADNLISGNYSGFIVLTSEAAEIEIPVSLSVVESIDPAFSETGLNFTQENKEFSMLYSDDPTQRASTSLYISAYNFQGFPATSEFNFKTAFFNHRTKIHLGEVVARRLNKLTSPAEIGYRHYNQEEEEFQLFRIFNYYKPASVDVVFEIENRANSVVAESKRFDDILFVSGRKPKQFRNGSGILNYETVPVRVTSSSQLLFNFVRRFLNHEIKVFKNNELFKTITHTPGNNSLFGLAMYFHLFKLGDVIEVRMYENETDYFSQKYLMFPEQPHSNHIFFSNEYNVPEGFEFTGKYRFSGNYKNVTSKVYRNLVEHIENLESNKEQRLVINTGWILKSNVVIVDAILRSGKVWLLKDGKEISLRPVDKELVLEDSEEALYQYNVEFIINLENDLEVYLS